MSTVTEPGTRVRYVPSAAHRLEHGEDLSAEPGTLTGTVVPLKGDALRELNAAEAAMRRSPDGRRALARTPRDRLVAVLRDDGNGHQFAEPDHLLPAIA